jgi:hypothetical protein
MRVLVELLTNLLSYLISYLMSSAVHIVTLKLVHMMQHQMMNYCEVVYMYV